MENHAFFNFLNIDRLKRNIHDWAENFPFISKIELLGPPSHAKDIGNGEEIQWEYKFVFVVTFAAIIGPSEKDKKSIWDYYNSVGDSPATWPLKVVFLDSYNDSSKRNIYDWRWLNIRQDGYNTDEIIDFWADRQSCLVLFDSGHDKKVLIHKYAKIADGYCMKIKNEKGQYPTEPDIKKYITSALISRQEFLGKQKGSRLPEMAFREIRKGTPYKRERGEKKRKT